MKDFAALYARLDRTTKTNEKVAALADYFRTAPGWQLVKRTDVASVYRRDGR